MSVALHREARDELRAAIAHYEAERRGLGGVLLDEVTRVRRLLDAHPRAGALVGGHLTDTEVRRHYLRRFPYSLIVVVQNERRLVIAFHHERRSDAHWQGRLREPA